VPAGAIGIDVKSPDVVGSQKTPFVASPGVKRWKLLSCRVSDPGKKMLFDKRYRVSAHVVFREEFILTLQICLCPSVA
jgi:hypothetical protein